MFNIDVIVLPVITVSYWLYNKSKATVTGDNLIQIQNVC